jgi:short-subunit dehydrogenase
LQLKPFNIKVIVINPGDFHTCNTANRTNITKAGGPYEEQFKKSIAIIGKDETGGWDPEIMARKICSIVDKKNSRNRYIVASFEQKLACTLKKLLPISMFSDIIGSHYGIK